PRVISRREKALTGPLRRGVGRAFAVAWPRGLQAADLDRGDRRVDGRRSAAGALEGLHAVDVGTGAVDGGRAGGDLGRVEAEPDVISLPAASAPSRPVGSTTTTSRS